MLTEIASDIYFGPIVWVWGNQNNSKTKLWKVLKINYFLPENPHSKSVLNIKEDFNVIYMLQKFSTPLRFSVILHTWNCCKWTCFCQLLVQPFKYLSLYCFCFRAAINLTFTEHLGYEYLGFVLSDGKLLMFVSQFSRKVK